MSTYLDYNASAPIDLRVLDVMIGYRVFHCVLDSEDHKQLEANVIAKDNLVLSLQEDVIIEFVNNDFVITR